MAAAGFMKALYMGAMGVALAWLAAGQPPPDASQGNEVFDEQCRSCHYADSVERKVGPGLQWLFSKDKLESNGKPVTDVNVLEKINGGGKGMPAYKDTLLDEDKRNLLAYLKTL